MWKYLESCEGVWTVGYYRPDGEWVAETDHHDRESAAARCSWLNGGRPQAAAEAATADPAEDDSLDILDLNGPMLPVSTGGRKPTDVTSPRSRSGRPQWYLVTHSGVLTVVLDSSDGSPGTLDSQWYDRQEALRRVAYLRTNAAAEQVGGEQWTWEQWRQVYDEAVSRLGSAD